MFDETDFKVNLAISKSKVVALGGYSRANGGRSQLNRAAGLSDPSLSRRIGDGKLAGSGKTLKESCSGGYKFYQRRKSEYKSRLRF